MTSVEVAALGTLLFALESALRVWILRSSEPMAHSIAWGELRGIKLTAEERTYRVWVFFFPQLMMAMWMPLGVGLGMLTLASETAAGGARNLLYLYAYLELVIAAAVAIGVAVHLAAMLKRIRGGQFGFVTGFAATSP